MFETSLPELGNVANSIRVPALGAILATPRGCPDRFIDPCADRSTIGSSGTCYEIQVEREGAHDGFRGEFTRASDGVLLFLQLLRVSSCQASEDEKAVAEIAKPRTPEPTNTLIRLAMTRPTSPIVSNEPMADRLRLAVQPRRLSAPRPLSWRTGLGGKAHRGREGEKSAHQGRRAHAFKSE